MKKTTDVTFKIRIAKDGHLVVSNVEDIYITYGGGRKIHRIRETSLHYSKYGQSMMTDDCRFYYGKHTPTSVLHAMTCEYDG